MERQFEGIRMNRADGADSLALARRLREAREYIGLSQESVAEYLGLSRPSVSSIERGTRKVSSFELKHLAELYRKSVAFLLGIGNETDDNWSVDSYTKALFRTTQKLDDTDRDQVLRFVEFLKHGPPLNAGITYNDTSD